MPDFTYGDYVYFNGIDETPKSYHKKLLTKHIQIWI